MSISPENLRKMIAEDEFGLLVVPEKVRRRTSDERLLTGFEEIVEFVMERGREPEVGASDIGERKLGMRLRAIVGNESQREALRELDQLGLLREPAPPTSLADALASDMAGLLDEPPDGIFEIRNVPRAAPTTPDKIAQRQPCHDFATFEPLFKRCHSELRAGIRQIIPFRREQQIRPDTYYVLRGLLVFVAAAGDKVKEHGRVNARLRCIFENGTEADMLLRSLSSQLYRFGKRITDPLPAVLPSMDLAPGTRMASIYVLRSRSADPQVVGLSDVHKIGSTKQSVEARTRNAFKTMTFLNAPVDVVAEYEVPAGVEAKIEHILQRLFGAVRLDVWFERERRTIAEAKEWFVVPLDAIDQAIQLIHSEAIVNYEYDASSRRLVLKA